jgi:NAD(P)-dependent dehydrogenase (short-subunit alcohol dehydrogenase family)
MSTAWDYSGRVVLVTGVGRAGQIGHAVARAFGKAGAKIVAVDRNAVGVAERVKEFAKEGLDARPAAGDLTEPDVCNLAVETAVKYYGQLDAVVNVAGGLTTYGPIAQHGPEAFDREININLKTAYLMSRAAAPVLAERGGAIVNFASIAYYRPMGNLAIYSAAKAGVAALTQSLAVELGPRVRVNAVAPATVRTPENIATMGPDAPYVELEQITNAVLYLAGDASSGITGQIIPITNRAL